MHSTQLVAAVALALVAASANAAIINSPASLLQCQAVAISWKSATPPVYLSIIPGEQPAAAPYEQFPAQQTAEGTYTWTVDQPIGRSITFVINDALGVPNYSAAVTVQAGVSSNCSTSSGSSSGTSSSPAASTGTGSGSTSSSGSSSAASSGSTPKTSSSSTSSTSASASNKSQTGAASQSRANVVLSGAAALIGAALALA